MVNSRDWIDCIVEETQQNYNGRGIVLWGNYGVSDQIKEELKRRYGIEIAFYVDKDNTKINNLNVFPTSCLQGGSAEYYVVVPVAFYSSLKEELTMGGYTKGKDYCYFCDCITRQTSDYYEDMHGNKVLGAYGNCKFSFSGFNSTINIGKSATISNCEFYIHNDSRIEIGENVDIQNSKFSLKNSTEIEMEDGCEIRECQFSMDDSDSQIEIGENVKIWNSKFSLKNGTKVEMEDGCEIRECQFSMNDNSKWKMGYKGRLFKQIWFLEKTAVLNIGDNFSAESNGFWVIKDETSVLIGEDCMFSYEVNLRSNDGHSIFDVQTGTNVNSTKEICRNRKIVIGNHVWLGQRTIILYNTEIGDGSIIGAGGLVKGKIPNNCIAAGVPAKVIRKDIAWSRKDGVDELMEHEKKYACLTE